jgi:hypothetical protein
MERDNLQQRAEIVPPCDYSHAQFALQALVDRLFDESDTRAFLILNKYFLKEEVENE